MSGVTDASIVAFYNKRGTCEQWIKEGAMPSRAARASSEANFLGSDFGAPMM
jgi:hypothetical protein